MVENIPVWFRTNAPPGTNARFNHSQGGGRNRLTLVTTSPSVISRIPVSNPILSYSSEIITDVSLSPIPDAVYEGPGFTSVLSTEVEDVFIASYGICFGDYVFHEYPVNRYELNFGCIGVWVTGCAVKGVAGELSITGVVGRFTPSYAASNGPIDSFDSGPEARQSYTTPVRPVLMVRFPSTGEVRTFPIKSGTGFAELTITAAEAKTYPRSSQPIQARFIVESGLLSPWVPVRFGPFASAVSHQSPESEEGFTVDTSGSYDLDDGIATRRFNIKIGATIYNVTNAAMETSSEVFKFLWDDLRELAGLALPKNVAVQFEFIVTDAGGLSDTATFSVVAPEATTGFQLGAVQSASGRLTFATIEGGAMKIRGGQLNGTNLKLSVLNTTQNASAPGLSIKKDNSLVRSYRTQSGAVTMERSRDGGKTWQ